MPPGRGTEMYDGGIGSAEITDHPEASCVAIHPWYRIGKGASPK
jgi:hypothetical protein